DAEEDDFDLVENEEADSKPAAAAPAAPAAAAAAPDDEYADMDDFGAGGLVEDVSALAVSAPPPSSNVVSCRTYDMSITYDKYYQTPRVWLQGYAPDLSPLSGSAMFEDVMKDYVKRTVTVEKHPNHPKDVCMSIHPCQHGAVMKNIVANMTAGGGEVRVEQSMFIFLKFVSSIIPTVNYDFSFSVSGAKTA
ncbi:hypothetical protein TeGR_g2615, partial [Tetraparma gracilis]